LTGAVGGGIVIIHDDVATMASGVTMTRENLGEFEELVLLAALRLGEDAYGLSISEEIGAITGRSVGRASGYVALRRMEQKGLITTQRERAEEAAGKPRRLVKVEPAALGLLRRSRRALLLMWDGLEYVLEEGR
jgi:DNA-binding PadR family transcriptional regulator